MKPSVIPSPLAAAVLDVLGVCATTRSPGQSDSTAAGWDADIDRHYRRRRAATVEGNAAAVPFVGRVRRVVAAVGDVRAAGDAGSGSRVLLSEGLSSLHNCTRLDDAILEWDSHRFSAVPSSVWFAEKRHAKLHRIQFAEGGNLLRYRQAHRAGSQEPPERNEITSFSAKSRFRLLSFMNSINRLKVDPVQLWMVTLTYPGCFPACWKTWKKHLKRFQMRLRRMWGPLAAVWKLEPQRRGAPHFHLIVCVTKEMTEGLCAVSRYKRGERTVTQWRGGMLGQFREWCSRAWYEAVDSGDTRHLMAGTNVEPLEAWEKAVSYAAKYVGKECVFADQETGEVLKSGRFWGVWNRELWPVRLITRTVDGDHWIRIRRGVRRYLEKQGRDFRGGVRGPAFEWIGIPRALSAFVPAEVVARLVDAEVGWIRRGFGSVARWYRDVVDPAERSVNLSKEVRFYT